MPWKRPAATTPKSWPTAGPVGLIWGGAGLLTCYSVGGRRGPNHPLQQTAAAISVFRDSSAQCAAAAAELWRFGHFLQGLSPTKQERRCTRIKTTWRSFGGYWRRDRYRRRTA